MEQCIAADEEKFCAPFGKRRGLQVVIRSIDGTGTRQSPKAELIAAAPRTRLNAVQRKRRQSVFNTAGRERGSGEPGVAAAGEGISNKAANSRRTEKATAIRLMTGG